MFGQEVIHDWSMTPDYTTWEMIMPLLIPKIIQFEGLQKKQSAKTKIYQFPSAAPSALFLKIRSYVIATMISIWQIDFGNPISKVHVFYVIMISVVFFDCSIHKICILKLFCGKFVDTPTLPLNVCWHSLCGIERVMAIIRPFKKEEGFRALLSYAHKQQHT